MDLQQNEWVLYRCPTCGHQTTQRADAGMVFCLREREHKGYPTRRMKKVDNDVLRSKKGYNDGE